MHRLPGSARPIAEAMEERILHSADLSPLQQLPIGEAAGAAVQQQLLVEPAASQREAREIVFIDAELSGVDALLLDLTTQVQAGRPLEVVLIGAGQDGIALISDTLAGRSDIGAVHLLAHGGDGQLQLGSARLDTASLLQRAGEIAGWGDALGADADLMLYGCDVAGSELGRAFALELAQLTGADVAASTDLTGAAALGGDWVLEFETGAIEAAGIASGAAQQAFGGVLATYVADPNIADGLAGSLRWAVSQANANLGADTIQLLAGTHRITLAGAENANLTGDFDISGDLTLVGASTNPADTVVQSSVVDRVFDVVSGKVSFSHLTMTGGNGTAQGGALNITNAGQVSLTNVVMQGNSANNGGAVYNVGSVTMERVRITGNSGSTSGGGLNNRGTATLTDVEISGNTNSGSGGGISQQGGTASLLLNRVTISGNTAGSNGGGIWGGGGTLSATNVTLSGNTAAQGGGLYANLDGYSISHSTIANNTATGGANAGGGIWTNPGPPPKQVTLTSTILASNTGGNANVRQASGGYNIDTDGTAIAAGGTDLNPDATALKLGALLDMGGFTRTHLLMGGSAAIDAGSLSAPATDQRGVARAGRADVGAFEFDGKLIVTTTADVVDGATASISALLGNMGADGRISLREAIIATNNTVGADEITLPGGSYVLSLSGNDNLAAVGDLDITDALTIIGAGARTTSINANAIDRVFEIKAAAATLSGVTVQGGSSVADGGAFLVSGNNAALTLRDSAISGSTAAGSGGAIHLIGTLVLDRVTIDGNTSTGGGANGGGALYVVAGSTATLTNVTMAANTATRSGGAIASRGTVSIVNSTIAGNTGATGGGIDVGGGSVSLRNTILANNTGGNAAGAITSLGHNIDSANTAALTGTGDRINTNPLLGALQYNAGSIKTMAIGAGSAAIDGGTAAGAPVVDARGFFRLTHDIGAYERNSLVVDTTSDVVDGTTSSIDALLGNRGFDGRISLREAVIASNNTSGVDDISLPAGTYTLSLPGVEDFAAAGDLDLRDSVRISGAGAASTLISGGGTLAVMQVVSGSSSLSGLTIADGYSSATSGGITVNAGATLTMSQVVVRNNSNDDLGAGIANAGNLTLTDVEVRDNSSSKDGGGIYNSAGSLTLNRVTIAGNSASKGGGLYSEGGALSLTNVTVSHNSAVNKAGGLAILGGNASLLNVTIADNQAKAVGGLDYSTALPTGSITLRNVLLAANAGGNIGADDIDSLSLTSLGNNLSTSFSPELSHATDRRNAVANLGTLGDWGGFTRTRPLLSGSAAINNANTAAAPAADQRGNLRVGNADIGAFEFGGAANAAPVLDASKGPVLATVATNAPAPVGAVGTLVSALADAAVPAGGLDNVSDADAGALLGIAVIGVDAANGSGWWSIDDGASWTAFGGESPTVARLLAADSQTRVYFQPNPGFSGSIAAALTIRAWDRSAGVNGGSGDSTVNGGSTAYSVATDAVSLLVAAAPVVVGTSGGAIAYVENDAPRVIDAGIMVSDADSATLAGATIRISANHASAEDVLGFTNQLGISGSFDAGTGVLTLSGSASVADYQTALGSVSYANTSDTPSTLTRTIAFSVNDGLVTSAAAERSVTVSAVNDLPSVATTAGTLVYTENDAATPIDDGLVLADADGTLASATVTISGNYANGQDSLVFIDQPGITGSWDAASGVLSLSGHASVAAWQAALRSVSYLNSSDNPSTALRTIAFVVNDGTVDSPAGTRNLSVAAVNDAPTLTPSGGSATYLESADAAVVDAGIAIGDVDSATLASATVSISANYASNEDRLSFTSQGGIGGSFDVGTGVLTLSGVASVADYLTVLRSVSYQNLSDAPMPLARTISFVVSDGAASSAAATRAVTLSPVNDAPALAVPAGQVTRTNTALVFSSANGNPITLADPDAGAAVVRLTLTASNGTLTLSGTAGLSFSIGDGTGDATMRFDGTLAAINAALAGLAFDPSASFGGNALLTLDADDLGNSGSGGALVHSRSVAIFVNSAPALNDLPSPVLAPVAMNAPAPLGAVGTLVSALVDLASPNGGVDNITDPDAGAQLGIAIIDADAANGSWYWSTDDGANWNALGSVSAGSARLLAADAQTRIYFQPDAAYSGTLASALTIRAWDRSNGVANGSALVDTTVNGGTSAYSMATDTVSLIVNTPPSIALTAGAMAYVENDAPKRVDPDLAITEPNGGSLVGASVAISGNYQSTQDRLAVSDRFGITASFDIATGVLTLSGSASIIDYRDVLRDVTYQNLSDAPSAASRTVTFIVTDGLNPSTPVTRDVSVSPVIDVPVLTASIGSAAFVENAAPVAVDAGITISDLDSGTLASATVSISANHASAQDRLVFADQDGISGSFDIASGVLTLSGTATLAQYQAALQSVAYDNLSDTPSTLARTVSFVVNDGAASSAVATRNVSVSAANDAPEVGVPPGQTTLANAAVVFSSANGNAITLGDADAGAAPVQLTLSVSNGTLTLAGTTGLTFSIGDGSADATIRFTGSLSSINAALNGLRFNPTTSYTGSALLTLDASDLGNSGSGGTLLDSDTVLIEVLSSNAAPVLAGANDLTPVAEDATSDNGTPVSALIAGQLSDADAGAMSGIAVTAVDNSHGQWQYSLTGGSAWTAFGTPTAASARLLTDDPNVRVRFVPAADWNGSIANGISFRAWDRTNGLGNGSTADTTLASPTVRDEFTSTFYGNNNGSTSWSAGWVDSDGSASGGQISIGSGRLNFAGGLLSSSSIHRQVNLSGAASATLSFDYTDSLGLSTLTLEVSRNGGASWSTLANSWSNGSNSASFDLGAFISANTRIRFSIGGLLGGGSFSLDNLQIAWLQPLNGGSTAFSSAIAASSITVTPVNDAMTGVPTISGSATEDQTLVASTAGLADIEGLGSFAYQWLRDGVAISGATGSTLLLGDADVGRAISVRVSTTDAQGSAESATSAATALVANINDAPSGAALITGSATEDATLGVDTSGLIDVDGLGAFSYQWLRDGVAIGGATGSTLVLGDADVGKAISVRLDWTDGYGAAESVTSAQTAPVANVNDTPSGAPTVGGLALENSTLTAGTAAIGDVDGLGTFDYQWLRNGAAIAGATNSTLVLGDADVGKAISVRVGWTDGQGTVESLTSAPTAAVINVNDAPTGVPLVTGSPIEDATLGVDPSGIGDADGLGAFGYQWLRDGVAIGGASASSYTLGDADVGARISVRVGWTDGWGRAESLTSAQSAPVANVNDAPTGVPVVTGSVTENATLGVDTSTVADIDGLGAFSYQWLRDGVAISGATGTSLLLGDADVGRRISVAVSWTDGYATAESVTSAQTARVANVNDIPSGMPVITGSATEDATLGVDTSAIADIDGLGAFSYQWLRDGVAISGATGATLTLGDADVGKAIRVRVGWTDGWGSVESLTSPATPAVSNVNDAPTGRPAITGSVTEDATLGVATSGIGDADGLGAFSYQWLRDGVAISGATGSSLLLGDADVGRRISVRVDWTDGHGNPESVTSLLSAPVANVNDAPTGAPLVTGTAIENATLGVATASIADFDGLGAFSYQWLRNGAAISGATGATLLLGDADVGRAISVRVSWTDLQGTAESLTSAATAAVVNVNDVPSGVPTIGGSTAEYQTLSALTGAIADIDGLGAFNYQWLRDGVAISGATGSSLLLGAADIGRRISVQVGWTDGWGSAESVTSAQTAPVANVNDAPTGVPVVTGSVTENATLGVDTSTVADIDGLGAFSYQWLRDGVAISGATGTSLLLGDADVGRRISVAVSWTDGYATAESVTSAQTARVANVNDIPSGMPVITGSATEDATLGVDTSAIADIDGLGAFSYQWLRDGVAISGATGATLTLGDADVGKAIRVRVGWTDGWGSVESLTSPATPAVSNVNDAPTGRPAITGSVTEDATLGVATSGIGDADGLGAFSYQWLRDGVAISGATGSSLLLGDADVGRRISVRVDWTDGHGNPESVTSLLSAPVANVNDAPTGAPLVTGTAIENATLGVNAASIADIDGLGAFSYQWLRNGAAISGATGATLLLGDADVGRAISVRVSWTDLQGTAESLTSAATAAVVNVNDVPSGVPTIGGSTAEYQTLSALTGAIADIDGLGAFSYQWLRDGVAISGATGSSLLLGAADIGRRISVQVGWTDGWGSAESVTSAQTAPVANTNDAPTGVPVITGSVTEDATLGIDTRAIADIDGLGAFSYQWLRDGVAISGATGTSLLLGDADVGRRISVRVGWTDGFATAESVTSVQSAPVANVNDVPTGAPSITGSAIEDRTLSVDVASIADIDGLGAFSYQWLRDGVAIGGASASSLLLGDADVGRAINVRVNWTDAKGTPEVLTSAATAPVLNINDAPRGSNAALPVFRNGSRALVAADFGFVDFNGETDALQSVRVQLPSVGTLRLAGNLLSATTDVTRAQLDAGALVYAPVAGASGNGYATIGFQVRDDGGTLDGGVDLDPTLRTLTINVINRAPTIDSEGGGASAAVLAVENGMLATTVSASDADGDGLVYSIVGGADAARLRIDAASGVLRFVVPPNFEAPIDADRDNIYRVTVRASDGLSHDEQVLSVRVTDVVEAIQNTFEIRVNTTTADSQLTAMANRGSTGAVALAPNGDHVVVWSSLNQDGSGWGVYGQRFDKTGAALGSEFRVNLSTSNDQHRASVAIDVAGNFVVAWTIGGSGSDGMRARVFAADGSARSGEIQVNSYTSGNQTNGSVAMDANGNFVIVWQGPGPSDGDGIFARRFNANGAPIDGTEFRVNADVARPHYDAAISMNASGAFAIAWDNGAGVQLRMYGADGAALGGQITVSTSTSAGNPALALADDGVLQVVWRETATDQGVYLQRYGASGAALGGRSVVNTVTTGNQTDPSIAVDGNGRFVVGWEGIGAEDNSGVYLQKYDASGARIGANVLVNQTLAGAQNRISLAMLDPDNLVAVWSGQGVGDPNGVFMRQYGSLNTAPRISSVAALPSIAEDSSNPAGVLVSMLIAGRVTDPDPDGLVGVAITGVDDSHGVWQYAVDGGSDWAPLGARSDTSARLLAADALTRVRFVPAANWYGSVAGLTLRAWDRSSGGADTLADTSAHGGTSAFSSQSVVASISVTSVADAPTGAPLVIGSAVEDRVLGVDTAGIGDDDGLGAFSHQWLRNGVAINGATGTSLLLGDADVGKAISVRVSWIDGDGTVESLTSAATAPVVNVNDVPTGLPTISGSAVEDATLSSNLGAIADADGLGSFSRQWLRNGNAIAGATGSSYRLGDADVGAHISLRVSWTDGNGGAEVLTSAATAPVLNVNDAPTGVPTVAGSAIEDGTLSAVVSGIADADGLGAFSYQWLRNGSVIGGATGSSFAPGDADVGGRISVRVSWTDGNGTAEVLTSAATAPVVNVNDMPTGRPVINGSAIEDRTLGVHAASIGDADGLGSFAWQWLRDGSAIAGATGTSLLLGDDDVGRAISVRVDWTDGNGTAETLTSAASAPVVNVNDAPVLDSPLRDRRAVVGQPFLLAIADDAFSDVDPGDSLVFDARAADGGSLPAWLRFDPATRSFTGTPDRIDTGEYLIRVRATDAAGASVSDELHLEVVLENSAPRVGQPVLDQQALEDEPFTLALAPETFIDTDHRDVVELSASLADGADLPSWLSFDAASATFSGVAGNADVGSLRIRVVGTDLVGETAELEFTLVVLNANDAPQAGRIADQTLRQDESLRFVLPADSFSDIDAGDVLSLDARLDDGSALPSWLRFDAASSTFSGTPGHADVGAISVRVTATDLAGASVTSAFRVTVENVNDAPQLAAALPALQVAQDSELRWTLPAGSFIDVDADDSLGYTATLAGGAALPDWLRFDAATRTLSGTPGATDVAALTLRITATDPAGASAGGELTLSVLNVNDAPVAGSIADQALRQDEPLRFVLPADSFSDIDADDVLSLAARLSNGSTLPAWLRFDAASRTFSGTPGHADVGAILIRVSATDVAGASARSDFAITVENVNDAPALAAALPALKVAQDSELRWTLPADRFVDVDAGDSLGYAATLASGAALPDWLRFDAATRTFSGTPGATDVGVLVLRIVATDLAGATASGELSISVLDVNDAPVLGGSAAASNGFEDSASPPTRVRDLIADRTSDVDAGALTGIAVIAADNSHGRWQYSLDGVSWSDLGSPAAQQARLLAADATSALRFVPAADWHGELDAGLVIRAWDRSSGSAGDLADASSGGGASAFSAATAPVALRVLPVNDAPVLEQAPPDQSLVTGQRFELELDAAGFTDRDAGDVLSYQASLIDGSPLPRWLVFDAGALTFKGSPSAADIGTMTVRVTATDAAGASAQALFVVDIDAAPVEPRIELPPVDPLPEPVVEAPPAAAAQSERRETARLAEPVAIAPEREAGAVLETAALSFDAMPASVATTDRSQLPTARADAVLATLPAAQFSELKVEQALQLLRSEELLRRFDDLQHQMKDLGEDQRKVMASSLAITSGLSIGYVVWLVRGGVLVSSMLSALPAWQMIDPMPVLAAAGAVKKRLRGAAGAARTGEDDHDVEELFDAEDPSRRRAPVAPQQAGDLPVSGGGLS